MELESYLNENYKSVKKLKNGYYDVVDKNNNRFFVPEKIESSTKLYAFLPGAGCSGGEELVTMMRSNNPPNCLVALSHSCNDDYDILDLGTKIITDNSSNVKSVLLQSFSAGGYNGYVSLNDYLGDHPELGNASAYVTNDGGFLGLGTEYNMEISDLDNLIKYKVPVIKLNPEQKVSHLKPLLDAGINVIGLSGPGDHDEQNARATRNGIGLYINGEVDEIKNINIYKFYSYDYETGKLKAEDSSIIENYRIGTITGPEAEEIPVPTIASLEDINDLTKAKIYEIKEEASPVIEAFKDLKNLETLSINKEEGATFVNASVGSNADYVQEFVNDVRGKISGSSFLTGLKVQSFNSSGGIPGIIPVNINNYFTAVGEQLESLSKETSALIAIAQYYIDYDKDYERRAEQFLSTGLNAEPPKEEPSTTPTTPSTTPTTPSTTPRTTPSKPSGGGTGGGSGSIPASTPTPTPTTQDTPQVTPTLEQTEKVAPTVPVTTIEVTDDKVYQKCDDGSTLVISYKGDKVESISYVYEYKDETEAQAALEGLLNKYNSNVYVSGIVPSGNKVNVIFDEKFINKVNISDVKKKIKEAKTDFKLEDLIKTYLPVANVG